MKFIQLALELGVLIFLGTGLAIVIAAIIF